MKIDPEKRGNYIKKKRASWGKIKPYLEQISFGKCWYCEIKNTRYDNHVDHHRPKNRIKNEDGSTEEGYWWLAFNVRNFRLACSFCNCLHRGEDGIVRGKADKFPLISGDRGTPPNYPFDEQPILLDPTEIVDPPLLSFLDDGRATPYFSKDMETSYKRAQYTIETLNLNDKKITEARKALKNRCDRIIRRGDEAYKKYRENSLVGREQFKRVITEAMELIDKSSELSKACSVYIKGSGRKWVNQFID